MYVRQRQDLMYLPELDKLEIVTTLHESIVREVTKGMRAKVYVEGLPGRKLEGHVTEVAALPTLNWFSDVRYFDSKVKTRESAARDPPRDDGPGRDLPRSQGPCPGCADCCDRPRGRARVLLRRP